MRNLRQLIISFGAMRIKSTLCCFLLLLIFFGGLVNAQSITRQLDSLPMADTVHLNKRRVFLTMIRQYDYRYASNLADMQLMPLLRRSADSTVQRYVGRGRSANLVFAGMYASGFALMTSGLVAPIRQTETRLSVMLGGLGLFYAALIPLGGRSNQLEQAVSAHNRQIRSQADLYFSPVVGMSPPETGLSPSDSVTVIRRGLSNRYMYRGVWVDPARQLKRLANRLDDPDVRNGFEYNRRVSTVAGLFTSLGAGYLVPQLLIYGVLKSSGRSATLSSPIFWTATAATVIGAGISFQARRVQLQTVNLLNDRLRDQYNPARYGEHFQNP